ncbi:MAG TPA: DUF5069 domain-containing protein [Chthoniobacteraceae bacterium]|nr:DUF5069 domain-containing protein [Chthoniobacteraceae bacterium]
MSNHPSNDLTQFPPRSPRVRLGGYVILPRMLDKCRALLAGKNGEYNYACPLDQRFLTFTGVDPEALKAEVAKGKGDGELLAWIEENAPHQRSEYDITLWSALEEARVSKDAESRAFFQKLHEGVAPQRSDVGTWFDLLDLDDYVSYGGKA